MTRMKRLPAFEQFMYNPGTTREKFVTSRPKKSNNNRFKATVSLW